MLDTRTAELISIAEAAFTKKGAWDQLCQDICENFYPLRADYTQSFMLGGTFADGLMDGFTVNARETLGNGIESMLRQGDWFKVGTGDEERDEKPVNALALEYATGRLQAIIKDPRARFQIATKEADMDWVSVGQPVLSVEEDLERTHLVYKAHHPKTCAWIKDDAGRTVTFFRKFDMQARDIKKKVNSGRWKPPGGLPTAVEIACNLEPAKTFKYIHVLMATDDVYGDDGKKLREIRHPFVSIYIDMDNQVMMNEFGAPVFNYVNPQWRQLNGLPWGFSPAALNSLSDARMLQDISRVILEQSEKAVDPPSIGDGEVFARDINLYAGGFTQVSLDGRDLREVFTTVTTSDQAIRHGVDLKSDVRGLLAEAWLLNKLFLPNVREMRELEVMVRTEEFRRAALPFYTPIESEYHSPLLAVTFQMGVHQGTIRADVFPDELRDRLLNFTYDSPLNEAEGLKVRASFRAALEDAAAGAEVDERVTKMFDWRKATEDAVRGGGAKPDWFLSEEDMEAANAEADQKHALREAAEIAREGAGAAADVSNASMAAQQAGLA